jgi:SAM-dependent methyltransferase
VKPQDIVAAGYDVVAERYATWQSAVVGDPRAGYVERLLDLLPTSPDILEIGCGAGIEPSPTFARVGRLTGVDISQAQIERARRALPSAELLHADITTAAFPAGSFDAVVALYVLTHIPAAALPALLERIAGWLRPGGLLLATFGTGPSEEVVVDDWLGAPMYFSGFDEATNEHLVEAAGLTIVESRTVPMDEPESEPGRGPVLVSFHWILARKDA